MSINVQDDFTIETFLGDDTFVITQNEGVRMYWINDESVSYDLYLSCGGSGDIDMLLLAKDTHSIDVHSVAIIGDAWIKNRYHVSCIAKRCRGKEFTVSFMMDRSEPLPPGTKTIDAINNWILPYIAELDETEFDIMNADDRDGQNTCDDCIYFTGEECNGFVNEGSERYADDDVCEDFEPKLNT